MDKQEVKENNIISIPGFNHQEYVKEYDTPISDQIEHKAGELMLKSSYKMDFDFDAYRSLERRSKKIELRGGIVFKSPFKLVNAHASCQQCLYAFEVDSYGRGCTHNCVYCYAKEQLTRYGYWNNPFPAPVDITEIWKVFHTVFETDRSSKWRDVLEKRIPIRVGSMSDSFMFMDKKYKVTQEMIKIFNHYKYPHILFTRSDLVAHDDYLNLFDPDLCSIQMSIASTNDDLNKAVEPGTPSAKRRLNALKKLTQNGLWTTVRLNPFFPIHPDGYFSDPNYDRSKHVDPLNFSSFEMVDEIAEYGVQSILAGFVRLSPMSLKQTSEALGRDLKVFFKNITKSGLGDYYFSAEEVRAYYERIQAKCAQNGIQFTTCYIGNEESQFWRDQDLWSNKKDCCNAIDRIKSFNGVSSRDISFQKRLKFISSKCATPNNEDNLHKPLG